MKKGEASATWTSLVKIHYDGVDYDAGMVIGAALKNGKVSTQIGFSAQTFIVYNPANGKMEPVFAIQNGQVVINSAFIGEGTITNAKIADTLQSTNFSDTNKTGWKLNMRTGEEIKYGQGTQCYWIETSTLKSLYNKATGKLKLRIGEWFRNLR